MSAPFFGVEKSVETERLSGYRARPISEAELERVAGEYDAKISAAHRAHAAGATYWVNPDTFAEFVRIGVCDERGRFL